MAIYLNVGELSLDEMTVDEKSWRSSKGTLSSSSLSVVWLFLVSVIKLSSFVADDDA
jgi:hypothetical protein